MQNCRNDNVSYRLLQQLLERAWDAGDTNRAMLLSQTMDEANVALIAKENGAGDVSSMTKKPTFLTGRFTSITELGL